MSRTVSFRCSEELDEFLEEEADRRMTTKSTVAQMIVAEYAQDASNDSAASNAAVTPEAREAGSAGVNESKQSVFDRNPRVWYEPNSYKHNFAVYVPDDAGVTDEGEARYYKTRDGAAKAIERWYE
jgi:predicted DNA-binding protein